VLLLPGFKKPPDSFRVPPSFVADGVEQIQNFTVFRFRSNHARWLRPRGLVRGRLEESDLRILVSPT
jgi:hypothetical protein